METTSRQISPLKTKSETPMWQYLFRVLNIFLSLMLLIILLTGGSIGKAELGIIVYLCLVVALDNLYRTGNLAAIMYLFKRHKI
jgi:hypothetical protein